MCVLENETGLQSVLNACAINNTQAMGHACLGLQALVVTEQFSALSLDTPEALEERREKRMLICGLF